MLNKILSESHKAVFFGGAGVSTESGIPDFRSQDGLYKQGYAYPPEMMLSHSFFVSHTEEFFRFYFEKMIYRDAMPNGAHKALALLEQKGRLSAVITQNIDGLHQKAGNKNVYELHGSVQRNICMDCKKVYSLEYMLKNIDGVPKCEACGGTVKPDVVLYEEALDQDVMAGAITHIQRADTLIVGGTSLAVYPAAGMLDYFTGRNLVLINKTATPYDRKANLVIREPIGTALWEAVLNI